MTQYNPPTHRVPIQAPGYAQADPYAGGEVGGLKRCRTAAIVQLVVGVCISLMAFCVIAAGAVVVLAGDSLPPEQQLELSEITSQLGDWAGAVFVITGICIGTPGLAQIVLSLFVWRGSKPGIILSGVLSGLLGGLSLLSLGALTIGGQPANPLGACMNVLMLAVSIGLVVLLVMAYREASLLKAAQSAYEAQWQSYYQQLYQYQLALQQMTGTRQTQADGSAARSGSDAPNPGQAVGESPLSSPPGQPPPPPAPPGE